MKRYYKFVLLFLVLIEIVQTCLCANSYVHCIEQERQALLHFKASVTHDSPNNLSSWKGTHCCQWDGIGCDNVTGHVVKLDLRDPCYHPDSWWQRREYFDNYLENELYDMTCSSFQHRVDATNVSSSLLQLEHLTYLDLTGNDFSGSPIPMFIGSMEHLQYLSLSGAGFSGRIPTNIGNLKNLQFLDLSFNYYYFIDSWRELQMNDDTSWISKLHSLKHLDLDGVPLRDTSNNLFQVLNTLPSLLYLSLYGCEIDNSLILHYALQNMSPLVYLDLSSNELHGPIPESFRYMTSIESLSLSENSFTSIPPWLAELKKLVNLDLSDNQLTLKECFLSSIIINMCHLKQLVLSRNKLQGELMGHFELSGCNRYDLEILNLKDNDISDSMPTWLGQLENLKYLDFSSNSFHGPIPLSIGKLSKLQELHLSNNALEGVISSHIGQLVNLTHIDLSSNKLKGEIPQLIGDMKSLESLDISQNQLSGTIPKTMSALTSLSHLNLSHNNFSGPIPKDNQFSTFDPSIYAYNPYLCGSPLPNLCLTGDISHGTSETKGDGDEDEVEKLWFYFVIALGFTTGLWGVIGTLWLKKNWRHAYFRWVENVADKIYVAVVVEVPKIKKKMRRNHVHG